MYIVTFNCFHFRQALAKHSSSVREADFKVKAMRILHSQLRCLFWAWRLGIKRKRPVVVTQSNWSNWQLVMFRSWKLEVYKQRRRQLKLQRFQDTTGLEGMQLLWSWMSWKNATLSSQAQQRRVLEKLQSKHAAKRFGGT